MEIIKWKSSQRITLFGPLRAAAILFAPLPALALTGPGRLGGLGRACQAWPPALSVPPLRRVP